jgi:hypothetical protein
MVGRGLQQKLGVSVKFLITDLSGRARPLIMLRNHFPRSGTSQEASGQYCGISNLRYAGFNMSTALVIFADEKKSAREFHDNLSQNLCQMAGVRLIPISHSLLS